MARKRFAGLMLLSWFIPVIGGVAAYFLRKGENMDLARVLLAGSFAIPLQIVGGLVAGLIGVHYLFVGFPLSFLVTYALIRVWSENRYRHVLWSFYLGVIGAIYGYYWPYKDSETIRSSLGWFALGWVLIYFVLSTLVSAILANLWAQNIAAQA